MSASTWLRERHRATAIALRQLADLLDKQPEIVMHLEYRCTIPAPDRLRVNLRIDVKPDTDVPDIKHPDGSPATQDQGRGARGRG